MGGAGWSVRAPPPGADRAGAGGVVTGLGMAEVVGEEHPDPGVRDSGLLAVGARLQLRFANQLVQLYRHVSAPRRGSVQRRTPVFHSGTKLGGT